MGAGAPANKGSGNCVQVFDVIQPFHHEAAVKPFDIAGEVDEVGFGQVFPPNPGIPVPRPNG